jgi:hypothetical protein
MRAAFTYFPHSMGDDEPSRKLQSSITQLPAGLLKDGMTAAATVICGSLV